MSEAIFGFVGVLVGAMTTVVLDVLRSSGERKRERQEALREACAAFTSVLAQIDLQSSAIRHTATDEAQSTRASDGRGRLPELQVQARRAYETLRLLLESQDTQESGRMVLRHSWSL